MEDGEILIAKSIQAVRDGEAIMSAVIDVDTTWIKGYLSLSVFREKNQTLL